MLKKNLGKLGFVMAMVAALALSHDASAVAALGATGVAVGDYVTLAITGLGLTVALVVGGFFAFLLIRKGMGWGKRAL